MAENVSIAPAFKSDHSPVALSIKLNNQERGKRTFKLKCSLLKETEYLDGIRQLTQEVSQLNKEHDPTLLWALLNV